MTAFVVKAATEKKILEMKQAKLCDIFLKGFFFILKTIYNFTGI